MSNSAQINSNQLSRKLEKSSPDSKYLFLGEEDGVKDKLIDKIAGIIEGKLEKSDIVKERFHVEGDEFTNAVDFALSQSMFTDKKICIILNIDKLGFKGTNKILFEELISDLPDSTTLVMSSSQNTIPRAFSKKILEEITVVRFWRHFENDILQYIRNILQKDTITIEDGAAHLLIKLLGRDIRKIDGALEKLRMSGEKNISESLAASLVGFDKDVSIFDFLDALFKKKKESFTLLTSILDGGTHELVVLTMISRTLDNIESFHCQMGDHGSVNDIMTALKVLPKNRDNFLFYTEKFSSNETARLFTHIYKTEQKIKSAFSSKSIVSNPVFELVTDMVL